METEIKEIIIQTLKPYEERIEHLEQINRDKDREIITLKHAIANLTRIIDSLKLTPPPTERKEIRRSEEIKKTERKRTVSPRPLTTRRRSMQEDGIEVQFGRKSITLYPPTQSTLPTVNLPSELSITRIQGYNGKTIRNNLFFVDDSLIIYSAGKFGVIYNLDIGHQGFYEGHDMDIQALAIHRILRIVASGQQESKQNQAEIHIWQIQNKSLIGKVLIGDKGVQAIDFDKSGEYLACVGADSNHTITVWKWQTEQAAIFRSQQESLNVLGIVCDEFNDRLRFITYGEKHAKLWSFVGNTFDMKRLKLLPQEQPKIVLCGCFMQNGNILLGGDNGHIYQIQDFQARLRIKSHEGPLTMLKYFIDENNDQYFISSGFDNRISLWNDEMQLVTNFSFVTEELLQEIPQNFTFKTKSLDVQNTGIILLGTSNNMIIRTSLSEESQILIAGHCAEINAIAVHPSLSEIITVSEDKTVRVWDASLTKMLGITILSQKITACVFNSSGKILVIGMADGVVKVFDWPDLGLIHELRSGKEMISTLKFSPDSKLLVSSGKDKLTIWNCIENYKQIGILTGIIGTVSSITISQDSKYIAASSYECEIMIWDIRTKRAIKPASVKDQTWTDWSLPIGWPVKGFWRKATTEIRLVGINTTNSYIAAGDSSGVVKLAQFPYWNSQQQVHIQHQAHLGSITNIKWIGDGMLISTGVDSNIILWTCMF